MIGLFYLWHGVVLRDLERVQLPIPYFFALAAVLYLFIAIFFTVVFTYLKEREALFKKGFLIGMVVGFVIYLAVYVLGVSFSYGKPTHILVDFIWQMFEQGFGAALGGFIFQIEHERSEFLKKAHKF